MKMEKNEKYIAPECEEIAIRLEGCIADSGNQNEGEGGIEDL